MPAPTLVRRQTLWEVTRDEPGDLPHPCAVIAALYTSASGNYWETRQRGKWRHLGTADIDGIPHRPSLFLIKRDAIAYCIRELEDEMKYIQERIDQLYRSNSIP